MKYSILFLIFSCFQVRAQEVELKQLTSAVIFLQSEICENDGLRDFYKKEKNRKSKLQEFRVSSDVSYLRSDEFRTEFNEMNLEHPSQFENYKIDSLSMLSLGDNGLTLKFSKPNCHYILAELSALVIDSGINIKFGKSSKLLFILDKSNNIIDFRYKNIINN